MEIRGYHAMFFVAFVESPEGNMHRPLARNLFVTGPSLPTILPPSLRFTL